MSAHLFTSESVTEGHPDKVADYVSDSILSEILARDTQARVAVETLVTGGQVVIAGEVTTSRFVDIEGYARKAICDLGYDNPAAQFDGNLCGVLTHIVEQSPDIAQGVDDDGEGGQGAGDQGMMFGYACNETPELMPLPIALAHGMTRRLAELRTSGAAWVLPDGKAQVTVEYDDYGSPVGVAAVVVSTHHTPDVGQEFIRGAVMRNVILPTLEEYGTDLLPEAKIHVNPTGAFLKGGPGADTGLTGRKIIVDTYGGMARHGGGAFSGKDPSKVDRSAAYAARWVAKNIVAAGLAERCEVQVAYAIGVEKPVSLMVDTFGTSYLQPWALHDIVERVFDLRPAAIVSQLDLLYLDYRQAVNYGHFGKEGLPWERLDKVKALKKAASTPL